MEDFLNGGVNDEGTISREKVLEEIYYLFRTNHSIDHGIKLLILTSIYYK